MKVISYTCLHYGVEYLEYALRSVIDAVDEAWILYTPVGSHGSRTDKVCPDSRDDLFAAATRGAGDKLRWFEGEWLNEGQQRETIHLLVPDADAILVVDADEIWPEHYAKFVANIESNWHYGSPYLPRVQRYRLPMIHYWRSFYRAILHDPAFPERIIFPNAPAGSFTYREDHLGFGSTPVNELKINHMGYAQRPEIIEYKQHTHGHRGEWRKDNWFNSVFMDADAKTNLHPVGSDYWAWEPVNPLEYMPAFMASHPYFNKVVIE